MKNKIKNLPYARILIPDSESGQYSAEVLELHGCYSEGATPKEAYENLDKACANWIDSAKSQGMEIPAPLVSQGYNGKIALRLPKSLHRRAVQYAAKDGVSLNQFLLSAIAERVGAEEASRQIVARMDDCINQLSDKCAVFVMTATSILSETSNHFIRQENLRDPIPFDYEQTAVSTAQSLSCKVQ